MTTAARHDATGRLVGYTEVVVPLGAPESSWQHDTLVMREHRGHGLGLAMKVANLGRCWSGTPACAPSAPGTRTENAPMIAVNDEMGFGVVAHAAYWLRDIAALNPVAARPSGLPP